MDETVQTICETGRQAILAFMRTHSLPQWPPEDYWWFALMHAWGSPWWRLCKGAPISVRALDRALLELGVRESEISRPGAHTLLELDNLAFVYREKRYKDGRTTLKIAPHIRGLKFSRCGHSFIDASGSALELAQYLLEIDRAVPALKAESLQAFQEGLRERRIREIKLETARVFLSDFFRGELPQGVVGVEIADSKPGACDLIRLTVHDEGTPLWRTRTFDIPFEMRRFLQDDQVRTFIDEMDLQFGTIDTFEDEQTGETCSFASYRPYVSETEKNGETDE